MASIVTSAAVAAHTAAANLLAASPIKVGDQLPAVTVKEGGPDKKTEIHNLPGKILIVGVPGAFSGACSAQIPEYINKYTEFTAKGIAGVYVVSVNDAFVVNGWKDSLTNSAGTPVHFIADDTGEFTSKVGLIFDATPLFGGPRSKRYALVAENGKVSHLAVEQVPSDVKVSKAETVLAHL